MRKPTLVLVTSLLAACSGEDLPGRYVTDVTVRDAAGNPVADAQVEFYFWQKIADYDSGSFANRRCALSSSDGKASRTYEQPDKYLDSPDLVIRKEGYLCAWHQTSWDDPEPCVRVFGNDGASSSISCVLRDCAATCTPGPRTRCTCQSGPPPACVEADDLPSAEWPSETACL